MKKARIIIRDFEKIAHKYFNQGNFESAIDYFKLALKYSPESPGLNYHIGIALINLNKPLEALDHFKCEIMKDSKFSDAYFKIACINKDLNKLDNAIKYFDIAISLDNERPEFHYYRAKVFKKLGRYTDAIDDLHEALKYSPNDPYLYYMKAICMYNLDQSSNVDFAIKLLNKAIKLDSTNYKFHFLKGFISMEYDFLSEAIKSFELSLSLNPNHADTFFYLSETLYYAKLYSKALTCLDNEVTVNHFKNEYEYYFLKAKIFNKLASYDAAFENIQKALELNPELKNLQIFKLKISFNSQNYEEVLEKIDDLISSNPDKLSLYHYKAYSLYKTTDKIEEAISIYQFILKIDPNNIKALYWMGKFNLESENLDQALESFNKLTNINEENPEFYVYKAVCLFKLKHYYDASINLHKAKTLNENPDQKELYPVRYEEVKQIIDDNMEKIETSMAMDILSESNGSEESPSIESTQTLEQTDEVRAIMGESPHSGDV